MVSVSSDASTIPPPFALANHGLMMSAVKNPFVWFSNSGEYKSRFAFSSNELIHRRYLCTGVSDADFRNRLPLPIGFDRDCMSGSSFATLVRIPVGTILKYRCARFI